MYIPRRFLSRLSISADIFYTAVIRYTWKEKFMALSRQYPGVIPDGLWAENGADTLADTG
jgi:hypothetical protein